MPENGISDPGLTLVSELRKLNNMINSTHFIKSSACPVRLRVWAMRRAWPKERVC